MLVLIVNERLGSLLAMNAESEILKETGSSEGGKEKGTKDGEKEVLWDVLVNGVLGE